MIRLTWISLLFPLVASAWITNYPKSRVRVIGKPRNSGMWKSAHSPDDEANDDEGNKGYGSRRQWFVSTGKTTAKSTIASVSGATIFRWWISGFSACVMSLSPAYASSVVSTASTCDTSVSVWEQPETGRKVYILGTAHISTISANLAGELVDDVRPDAVFVELDAKRVQRMTIPAEGEQQHTRTTSMNRPQSMIEKNDLDQYSSNNKLTNTDVPLSSSSSRQSSPSVIASPPPPRVEKGGLQPGAALVGGALKGMYSKLGDAGFRPGEEFAIAIREGQTIGATVILGDRDVEITLQRLSEALRKTDWRVLLNADSELEANMKALLPENSKLPSDNQDEAFREEMTTFVEAMKAKENVKLLMEQLSRLAPEVYQALVAERDIYMANGLDKLNAFPVIVAVMGMAHVDGVETYLKSTGWISTKLRCPPTRLK
jgi:TraB/PrgY/gumN family